MSGEFLERLISDGMLVLFLQVVAALNDTLSLWLSASKQETTSSPSEELIKAYKCGALEEKSQVGSYCPIRP